MKRRALRVGWLSGAMLGATALAGIAAEETAPVAPPPPAEQQLQKQDSAFALLIESFRQMQLREFEQQHQTRLAVAKTFTDPTQRAQAAALAQQQRDQQVQELAGKFSGLASAYAVVRKTDERDVGHAVPSAMDTKAAAERLNDYVVLRPTGDAAGTWRMEARFADHGQPQSGEAKLAGSGR